MQRIPHHALILAMAALATPLATPLVPSTRAAEPEVKASDLPRRPAVEPAEALKTFQIKKGYRVELAAAEPLVVDPVAASFDEQGRLFVAEMRDYSERRDEKLSRVRMLADTDGDGRFGKATVYAEGLPWATAVFCYGGGVFVGASPDIYYFKDTDGDGVADEKKVVFTGFASGVERLNVQALLNSFYWGLDNRIYGAASMNAGTVTSPANPQMKPLDLRGGKGFSFDPKTLEMRAENGGGQHGFSFDTAGRAFVSSNSDHIQSFTYDARYAGRNPNYAMPNPRTSIAADGPAAEVFRISPEEPWRMIRTRWRVAGLVSGPVEGGGRSAGYFTGATGVTIYRGDALGAEFLNNAFVGDAGGNLVHRKVVRQKGAESVELVAERPADEMKMEFLASSDTWFRPVQFANAPDGALYVLDMYRETIEHPWSLPPSIKQYLDLNSGNDRGRVYRVVPEGYTQRALPKLGQASTEELVRTLGHANGWHRDAAARLLYERQDRRAVPLLQQMVRTSASAVGRLHAMYALDGLGALGEAPVMGALADADAQVRRHAVRLVEKVVERSGASPALLEAMVKLATDESVLVRHQLALTLSVVDAPGRVRALKDIVTRTPSERWVQAAVLNALKDGAGEMFVAVGKDERTLKEGEAFLQQLATLVGARNDAEEVARVVEHLRSMEDRAGQFGLAQALGEGLRRKGKSLATVKGLEEVLTQARSAAGDDKASTPVRVAAIRLLGQLPAKDASAVLAAAVGGRQPNEVQLAALNALDGFGAGMPAEALLQRWEGLPPRVRNEALVVLTKRPERAVALLNAIEAGRVKANDLSAIQTKSLLVSAHDPVRELAQRVLKESLKTREEVLKAFMPALEMKGDASRGKAVYAERCVSCHRLDGQGFALGPDLVTVQNTGKEKLLTNLMDPNREVQPSFLAYEVETKEGDSLVGVIVSDNEAGLTLRQAYGNEVVIPRADIKRMKSSGQSLMPEGLEEGLTAQQVADLLEYISTAKP